MFQGKIQLISNITTKKFNFHEEVYSGLAARIIQHEYDHLKGILFIDKLSQLKKANIKGRLNKISKGKIETKI